jgi:hypothetical protein
MTIQVEIGPEAEARLTAAAGAFGIPIERYAGGLLEEALSPHGMGHGVLAPGDIAEMTRLLTEGSENMPVLGPEANEREFYYEDRW